MTWSMRWHTAWREGLLALVVASMLTLLLLALGVAQYGADYSQRLLAGLRWAPLNRVDWRHPATDRKFVLLDVALDACGGKRDCRPTDSLKGERLARLLHDLRAAGPALVIVDSLVAGAASVGIDAGRDPSGLDPSIATELARPGPPVLMAWSAEPDRIDPETKLYTLMPADRALFSAQRFPAARFLPAGITGQPVARALLPSMCLSDDTNNVRIVPTLAAGAALVLQKGGIDALSRYPAPLGKIPLADCGTLPTEPAFAGFAATERVATAPPYDDEARAARETRVLRDTDWTHQPFAGEGNQQLPRVDGAVVLVGSTGPNGRDSHWTALGKTTGGEIILNDVRQFLLAEPAPAKGVWQKYLAKWPFLAAGFIAVAAACLILPHPSPDRVSGASFIRRSVCHFLAKLMSTIVAFTLVLILSTHRLHSPPDFLTPFLTLFGENVFELMVAITGYARATLGIAHGSANHRYHGKERR